MNIPDNWNTRAGAWIGRVKGRVTWAIATPEGVTVAEALPDDATPGDAAEAVIGFLANSLNQLGVDFHTNYGPLADVLGQPDLLAAAGMRLSHVTVLEAHQLPAGDTTLTTAQAAAAHAVEALGPVYVLAATDGGRRRKGPKGSKSAKGTDVSASGGYGWIIEDGRRGYGPVQSTCSLHSELAAIEELLSATDPAQPLRVIVDSRAAIAHAQDALAGKPNPPQATKATGSVLDRIKRHRDREVSFTWRKGHGTDAMNKAADELALLGRRGLDIHGTAAMVDQMADRKVATALAALRGDAISQAS